MPTRHAKDSRAEAEKILAPEGSAGLGANRFQIVQIADRINTATCAAGIENETHRERRNVLGEVFDILLDAVFKHSEIRCDEIG
jgi:hypothetical protein